MRLNQATGPVLACLVAGVLVAIVLPRMRDRSVTQRPTNAVPTNAVAATNTLGDLELLLVLERIQANRKKAVHPAEQRVWMEVEQSFVRSNWFALQAARERATNIMSYTNQP